MRKMGELVNLDKESLSSDLSRLLGPQNKESKESARIVREEKPFTLDVNENELYEGSKETVTFVTKIEIEENPLAYNCDACYEEFQKESELNAHNCLRTSKEQHGFTNGRDVSKREFSAETGKKIKEEYSVSRDHDVSESGFSDESEKKIPLKIKEEDSASRDHDVSESGFSYESEKKIPLKIKEEDSASRDHDVSESGFSDGSEKKIPLKIKEEDSASRDHDVSESGFSDGSEKKIPLKIKEEDSVASCDVGEKSSGSSESKILTGENPFACDICEKGFGEESELKAHLLTHRKGGSPYCYLCDRKYASVANLKYHLRTHAERKKYVCEVCSEGFSQRHLFQRHVLRHARGRDEERPFACDVCGRCFPDEFKMKMHHIGHTVGAPPFVCDVCKREFSKKQHLVRHIHIHTGERPFVCEVCNRGFYRTSELKIHALSHDSEKQARCGFCGKGFLRKNSLKIHLRNHTGDKPFVCSVCRKGFSQACDLRIHSYVHTEERPFACDVCNKGFYKRSFLVRHRLVHDKTKRAKRNRNTPNVVDDPDCIVDGESDDEAKTTRGKRKRFHCKFCERSYLTQRRLKIHLRNHSEKKTPFVCAVCQKGFSRTCDLGNHSCVRTTKPFACDICNEGFSRKCALAKHRRTHEEGSPSLVRGEASDDQRTEVSFVGKTDHSVSNEVSYEPKAKVSLEKAANHFALNEKSDDQRAEVFFAGKTDHSVSNKASDDPKSQVSSEKAANHFVLNETSDDASAKVSFVEEKWFSSTPAQKSYRTRGVCNRRYASQKLSRNHSSQSHPRLGTFVGDARHKETHARGKKVPRHSKGKIIGPRYFACNECDKVYSHLFSLKRHLQTHKLEATDVKRHISTQRVKSPIESLEGTSRQSEGKRIGPGSFACNECGNVYSHLSSLKRHLQTHTLEETGVNRHLSTQRVKSPIESLEENVHLFAPFKNFV